MASESQELSEFIVDQARGGMRLDAFLATVLEGVSRSKIKTWFDAAGVLRNGCAAKPRDLVQAGDVVICRRPQPALSPLTPVALPLSVLFEDEHLLVVDKPAGLAVHPGAGAGGEATLVQALLYHLACGNSGTLSRMAEKDGRDPAAWLRPGIVHRLDKDTSGVLVVAKTDGAHRELAKQFHDKTNRREYIALLDGLMAKAELVHESYLYRDPSSRLRFASSPTLPAHGRAKYAKSHFRREEVYGGRLSLARISLFTGRTHQIRVHARDLKLPIIGDLIYHRAAQLPLTFAEDVRRLVAGASRQMLHARLLGFAHPVDGRELVFEAPYPVDLKNLIDALQTYRQA